MDGRQQREDGHEGHRDELSKARSKVARILGSMKVPASLDHLDAVLDFVHEELEKRGCPVATQAKIDIALEELFVNVCNYAYSDQDEPGDVQVDYVDDDDINAISVRLIDQGVAFDPLVRADPTRPESIEDTNVGGLGIFMTKKLMDDITYLRDRGSNIVAFRKSW